MNKFFYSPDPVEAPAAPAEPVNIAAAMAKSGQFVSEGRRHEPVNTPEPVAPPAPEQPAAPAESATQPAAPVVETPPAQPSQPTPPAPVQAQAPTLTEFLKSHKPDTVLKELGYDDKVIGFLGDAKGVDEKMLSFLNDWKSGKDLRPRLEALTTDYSKMSAEDVMKHQLKQQNQDLSASDFERLYQRRIVDRYKIDPQLYNEQEVADGRVDLSIDSKPIREALIRQQQELLLPKSPEPQAAAPSNGPDPAQQVEAFRTQLRSDAAVSNLLQTKILPIGEGADQFKMGIPDPDVVLDLMADNKKWAALFYDKVTKPDGSIEHIFNAQRLTLTTAIARNPLEFIKNIGAHFKALGAAGAIAPIENATPPSGASPSVAQPAPSNPAAAMAKGGQWSR